MRTALPAAVPEHGLLVNMLDPEIVAGRLYGETPRAAIRELMWFDQACDLPAVPAATGLDAGLIGGAASIVVR